MLGCGRHTSQICRYVNVAREAGSRPGVIQTDSHGYCDRTAHPGALQMGNPRHAWHTVASRSIDAGAAPLTLNLKSPLKEHSDELSEVGSQSSIQGPVSRRLGSHPHAVYA